MGCDLGAPLIAGLRTQRQALKLFNNFPFLKNKVLKIKHIRVK